jgi:hypothetical protein
MTKKESKNSAENDNQEIDSTFRTGFYGSLLNPRYTSAKMLAEAAEIARTMNSYPTTGTLSAHALKYLQEEKENRRLEEKFHSSPVGELLK